MVAQQKELPGDSAHFIIKFKIGATPRDAFEEHLQGPVPTLGTWLSPVHSQTHKQTN